MGNTINFYPGANYGFDSENSESDSSPLGFSYEERLPSDSFSLTTRPDTANQLKEVMDKLNTGVKSIELTGISPKILEAIPEQHLEEINRLKKLVGINLTLHGPLIEPTGIGERQWDESQRQNAENQMLLALDRAHKLDPDGNIIVTFHSSNGLPEPRTQIKDEEGNVFDSKIAVINETTGQFGHLPKKGTEHFEEKIAKVNLIKGVEDYNRDHWSSQVSQATIAVRRGKEQIDEVTLVQENLKNNETLKKLVSEKEDAILEFYKLAKDNPEQYQNALSNIELEDKNTARLLRRQVDGLSIADGFVRDSYFRFKEIFNEAYESSKSEEDKKKLEKIRDDLSPKALNYKVDPAKISELADVVTEGLRLIDSVLGKNPPKIWKPLEEFAIEKASETFANVAFKAYKKFPNSAPIISIENPPVGMGLSRADDIKMLIEESQKKFIKRAVKSGISEDEAKNQAEKLIGATWDLGHINMMRKYGYDESDILEETKKIAPFIKHVHLSDNFGMEHTELPMGMGNVPTKKHFELMKNYGKQVEKLKKVIETGDWYQHFQTSPLSETLSAFGSPIYSMKMAPYWNKQIGSSGGYFAGFGLNPDYHQSIYGAGFSGLPTELGGQIPGNRSRLAGTPME